MAIFAMDGKSDPALVDSSLEIKGLFFTDLGI
jgi:hypothetical protein